MTRNPRRDLTAAFVTAIAIVPLHKGVSTLGRGLAEVQWER
jgi:hypothetical protein